MILAFISSLLVTDFFVLVFFHFFLIFSDLFGFGSCHGEGIGVSTEGTISTISTIGTVGTSIGVTSIGTSIGSMGVGRVGTVGTVVVGIGVATVGNGDRGNGGGSDNGCDNMSWLNSGENRGNGEGDSASSVGIKGQCVSSLSLSNLG